VGGGVAPSEPGSTSETPTPGGGYGHGFGAVGADNEYGPDEEVYGGDHPLASVAVTRGGAVGGGNPPGESEAPVPGGALAGGNSPSPWITVAVGGGIGAANAVTGATVFIDAGGATAGGTPPTAPESDSFEGRNTIDDLLTAATAVGTRSDVASAVAGGGRDDDTAATAVGARSLVGTATEVP
jgi:hypothetical protein